MDLPTKHQIPALKSANESLAVLLHQCNAMKSNGNALDIAEALVKIAHAKEQIAAQFDQLSDLERDIREHIFPQACGEKIKTINMLGYRATVVEKIKASISAEHKLGAFDWLRENGHDSLINTDPRINGNTLNAWAKTLLEVGDMPPEDLINVFLFQSTTLTKVQK